jgi:DNA-binding response OmpR family regulator
MVTTVAVVDDEPRIRRLYATWLEEAYEVVRAADGETALEAVDDDVDVVLLDRRMPDLTGDEVLNALRDRGSEGWVVMVTAVDPDVEVAAMPFDDYLVKPVDRETLRRAVEVVGARADYDADLRVYFRLLAKLAVLETNLSEPELEESEEYARLEAEHHDVKERLAESVEALEERGAYDDLFLDLPGGRGV